MRACSKSSHFCYRRSQRRPQGATQGTLRRAQDRLRHEQWSNMGVEVNERLPGGASAPLGSHTLKGWKLSNFYGTPKRNWVSRSTLLYHGNQYVMSSRVFGSAIISLKLVLTP